MAVALDAVVLILTTTTSNPQAMGVLADITAPVTASLVKAVREQLEG